MLKLTNWACGTNPPTSGRKRARYHQIGETKSTETEDHIMIDAGNRGIETFHTRRTVRLFPGQGSLLPSVADRPPLCRPIQKPVSVNIKTSLCMSTDTVPDIGVGRGKPFAGTRPPGPCCLAAPFLYFFGGRRARPTAGESRRGRDDIGLIVRPSSWSVCRLRHATRTPQRPPPLYERPAAPFVPGTSGIAILGLGATNRGPEPPPPMNGQTLMNEEGRIAVWGG